MKRKTTFLLYVLVGVIFLSSVCLLLYVRAADQNSSPSSCAPLVKDYLEKTKAFEDARDAFIRAKVATAKASPTGNVPPEWKEFEDEYDANPKEYLSKLKDGLSTHPNSPSNTSGLVSGLDETASRLQLMQAEAAAAIAYDAALAAQEEAERALANCTGQSIVTIWCERGPDCQMTPGVSGNPKAHYVYDCPDQVEGVLNINMDCPGQWWICDGVNECPRSNDHVVPCKGSCGDMVGPDRVDSYHGIVCETEARWIGCGQTYRSCNATDRQAHSRSILGDICPQAPSSSTSPVVPPPPIPTPPPSPTYHACGEHETTVSGDHSLQASCTSTDSNGNYCTVTNFYACSQHTHSYPDPLVACAHSNCTEMVSSRTSHRTQCGSGQHYYWPGCPNNTNWWSQDSTHALKTCRYSECRQTWYRCLTNTPICNKPYRQRNGLKCWAE